MEVEGRPSGETDLSSTAEYTTTSTHNRDQQNLEARFLRQTSKTSPKNDRLETGSVKESGSVDSFTSNEMLRSPSTASVGTNSEKRSRKKKTANATPYTPVTLNYHGVNIYQACSQGNLPLVVLLWGMASSKRISLMAPDFQGNNPMHFAALAESPEVLGFLIQQTRGQLTEEIRLVEARNRMGETPLLRAMNTGHNAVIKALIDESSDTLVFDYGGNNVFTVLAKQCHLWTLNYVYQIICNIHGAQVALELMSAPDNDGHTPLEWAADAGDVNVMEFFMRKGLSPFRRDAMNRTALFWAVKSGRVAAARYLVKCGCDIELTDTTGQSPIKLAQLSKSQEMLSALNWRTLPKEYHTIRNTYRDSIHDSTHSYDPSHTPPLFAMIGGRKVSHAIERRNRSSVVNVMIFALIVLVLWILTLVVPFWVWAFVISSSLLYHRYIEQVRRREQAIAEEAAVPLDTPPPSTLRAFLRAPEKGLGLWVGSMAMYFLYLASATVDGYTRHKHEKINNDYTGGVAGFHTINPLDLGGNSFVDFDYYLYYIVCGLYIFCVVAWVKLVWFSTDPGIIDTRDENFEEIMAQSFAIAGSPPPALFCRTTLVSKPIRSKFCTRTGCVIARMDHHCAWLNMTIGYHNHRTFVVFLQLHLYLCAASALMLVRSLHREVALTNTCTVLSILLNGEYFFVVAFVAFLVVASLGLLALSFEQLMNIAKNITTNERINHAHYYWMVDNDGTVCNKFDRGLILNTLEFWRVPGFAVDYTTVFELPTPSANPNRYTLTQENIMRYANSSHQLQLLSNTSNHGYQVTAKTDPAFGDLEMQASTAAGPVASQLSHQKSDRTSAMTFMRQATGSSRAGPPSIDFDQTKMRGESMDSNDTSGSII